MAIFKVKNALEATSVLNTVSIPTGTLQNGLGAPSLVGNAVNTSLNLDYFGLGFKFKPDGTRLWHSSPTSVSVFYQYNLSTAWDLSTAGTPSTTNLTYQRSIKCFVFKSDGTKLYVIRDFSTNTIFEYNVATAWDITSTLTLVTSFNVMADLPDGLLYNLHFSSDGTKMIGISSSNYAEYTLSTAWDISTATVAHTGYTGTARYYSFTDDGTEAHYVSGQDIYKATLSTAWDTTTLSVFTKQGSLPTTVVTPRTFYKKDATTGFILDGSVASSFQELETTYKEVTLNLSIANTFKVTLQSGTLINVTNLPPAGKVMAFSVEVTDTVGYSIGWDNNFKFEFDAYPLPATGTSVYAFLVTDNGTIYGRKVGGNFQ